MVRFGRLPLLLVGIVMMGLSLSSCGELDDGLGDWRQWTKFAIRQAVPYIHFGTQVSYSGINVTVNAGDSLYDIAQRNKVPLRTLIELNDLGPPFNIEVGQVIKLPNPDVYSVKRGDTLSGISRTFGVDQSEIVRLNRLSYPYTLQIGQALRLPPKQYSGSSRVTQTASVQQAELPRSTKDVRAENLPPVPGGKPGVSSDRYDTAAIEPQRKPSSRKRRLERQTPALSTGSGAFSWPLNGKVISHFGPKGSGRHNDGVNIGAPKGTVVRASENGQVVYTGDELSGFGNLVLVRHDQGWMTAYGHLDRVLIKRGQTVTRGQSIATVGQTGSVNSPQLHFEIRKGSTPQNPEKYLP